LENQTAVLDLRDAEIESFRREQSALRNQVFDYRILTELLTACQVPFKDCKPCRARTSRERTKSNRLLFPKGKK
jgi:hypothetical protein